MSLSTRQPNKSICKVYCPSTPQTTTTTNNDTEINMVESSNQQIASTTNATNALAKITVGSVVMYIPDVFGNEHVDFQVLPRRK